MIHQLIRIVNYKPPFEAISRNLKRKEQITKFRLLNTKNGHYTAICPRLANKWTEFDDILEVCFNRVS